MAYIRAIAADGGYGVLETAADEDPDCVDGKVVSSTGMRPQLDFQAKATTRHALGNGGIHLPLPMKNYDDLRADTRTPRILIVLLMPPDGDDWLTQSECELCLRRCAYCLSLGGMGAVSHSSGVMGTIPAANLFGRKQLDYLMNRTAAGGSL